jgi:excisionase family DNA binding protein
MSDPATSEYLTLAELCAWLKVPPATVYDWVHKRYIPHVKLGRLLRFERVAIVRWMTERQRPLRGMKSHIPA